MGRESRRTKAAEIAFCIASDFRLSLLKWGEKNMGVILALIAKENCLHIDTEIDGQASAILIWWALDMSCLFFS